VRDWADSRDRDDLVEETDGGVVWSKDANSFFYVKLDDNHRPMQVWRHRLGTKQATTHSFMRSRIPLVPPICMRVPAAAFA